MIDRFEQEYKNGNKLIKDKLTNYKFKMEDDMSIDHCHRILTELNEENCVLKKENLLIDICPHCTHYIAKYLKGQLVTEYCEKKESPNINGVHRKTCKAFQRSWKSKLKLV